jgi:hypothetical protein
MRAVRFYKVYIQHNGEGATVHDYETQQGAEQGSSTMFSGKKRIKKKGYLLPTNADWSLRGLYTKWQED